MFKSFKRGSQFEQAISEKFPNIKAYIKEKRLESLARDILADGLSPHYARLYNDNMNPSERAFFFYYLINRAMQVNRYKFAGDIHRNFVQEMIVSKNINVLDRFLNMTVQPEHGAFSYAAEVTMNELKQQADKCEDAAGKKELTKLLFALHLAYEKNKEGLRSNWAYLQELEEIKKVNHYLRGKIVLTLQALFILILTILIVVRMHL